MNIQLLNLLTQYKQIELEVKSSIDDVLKSCKFIMGQQVQNFEIEFAKYIDCNHAISCASGTDALVLTLDALGIKNGDEVITTPFTFFATAEAISRVGATPVFVDVNIQTYNIDPFKIEEKITQKTKAILPVHLFGQPADMYPIIEIAKKHGLFVIEDACQAVGAKYKDKNIGTLGDAACFSFFPTKNLGGYGDGGMITTNNKNLAAILRGMRVHGSGTAGSEAFSVIKSNTKTIPQNNDINIQTEPSKYYNFFVGYNSRLDEIQASILRIKLKYLDTWNSERKRKAEIYNLQLKNSTLTTPVVISDVQSVYHLYIVQSEKRDELANFLNKEGISTGTYYPVPLHLQTAYLDLGYRRGALKNAEYLSKRTFALPLYPELEYEQQQYIIDKIYEFEKN